MTDLGGLANDIDRLINSVYTENECKGNFYFIVKLLILYYIIIYLFIYFELL